ncbi:MAG TPA: hypothetical protein VK255_03695 [Patescibacteria group bacterium]|nr:hypothetical protein [Patescibacteria group bacterium]
METYSEDASIIYHQDNAREMQSLESEKATSAIEMSLKKLGNITYSINSFKEINDNLIGGYNLDKIVIKCDELKEAIKNNLEIYKDQGDDLQDVIGNFEGKMYSLSRMNESRRNEEIFRKNLQKSIKKFSDYLDEKIEQAKKSTLH